MAGPLQPNPRGPQNFASRANRAPYPGVCPRPGRFGLAPTANESFTSIMFKRKPKPDAKKNKKPARKPRLSWTLAAAVISLQAIMLLTLAVTSSWQPPRIPVIEYLWVWASHTSFYPMLMLLIGGPLLTWLACRMDAKKWGVMSLSWAAFGLTLVLAFGAEAQSMLNTLWQQIPV